MDDALVISGVFPKKSSTIVENEEWEWGAYSGDWVDGKPHGKGTVQHVFDDGVYEGDWVDGQVHGHSGIQPAGLKPRIYEELTDGVLLARSRASISLRISFCLCSVMG